MALLDAALAGALSFLLGDFDADLVSFFGDVEGGARDLDRETRLLLGEADFSAARLDLAAAEPVGFFDPDLAAVNFFLSAALSLMVVLTADLDLRVSRATVVLAFFTGEAALAEVVLRACFEGLLEVDGLAAAEAFVGDLDDEAALPPVALDALAGALAGDFEGDFDGFAAFLTDALDTDLLTADALVTDGALEAAAGYF